MPSMHGAICSPQGFKRLAVWERLPYRLQASRDEDVYVADLHVGDTHTSESAWWCFLPFRVTMGSHMSAVTWMKASVLADSFSGWFRPSDAQSQDWTTPYERLDGAMLGTPAGRLWHFESRCMSSDRPRVPMFGSFATTHDSAQAEILQKLNEILERMERIEIEIAKVGEHTLAISISICSVLHNMSFSFCSISAWAESWVVATQQAVLLEKIDFKAFNFQAPRCPLGWSFGSWSSRSCWQGRSQPILEVRDEWKQWHGQWIWAIWNPIWWARFQCFRSRQGDLYVSNLANATMHAGQPSLWWTWWHQAAQCAAEVVGAHFFDVRSPRARASYAWVAWGPPTLVLSLWQQTGKMALAKLEKSSAGPFFDLCVGPLFVLGWNGGMVLKENCRTVGFLWLGFVTGSH